MNIRVWGTSLLMFLSTVTAVGQTANRYLKAPLPNDWEESGEVFQQILPVDDHWWKSFQDAKLDSLIALAVDRNYSVAMAINRIAAARANLWIERSNFFPSIGLNAGWTRQETSGNTSSLPQTTDHYYDASLSMSWELDIFGSIRKRVKAQKENFAASKEEYTGVMVFGWAASVPAFLPFLASVLQAMVEFCLGVYLLFGIRRRMTTLFVVLIMGVMTPLTLWLALSNPISDCGCFGDAVTLTNWETFGKNVFLLIAAASVFKWGNRITPLVTKRFDWLVAMYAFLYISGMTLYCYHELPVFDFRPYHIGADIRKGMEIPEGAKPTVYETRFILQKNGVEKEFTLENYPDSTWTFVDSQTMVKEQGYEPPIHDFSIIRQEDGEDITDEVLDDDNYTFLLVAHQLSQADDSTIDLINELYDYSVEHGYQFYYLITR